MINHLQITQLRNLKQVNIKPSRCNVILGNNGSGKTSLLESLFLLSRGKSFRSNQAKKYISHHCDSSTVFAKLSNTSNIAIQKHSNANTLLRNNGNPVKNQSVLTRQIPSLLVDPSSMDILEIGSSSRRQLLDWLTFHVKHGFHPQWLAYQRLLKQRNTLLKQVRYLSDVQKQQISAWDTGLATHAELIHHYRKQVFDDWIPFFYETLNKLLPKHAKHIKLQYYAGYDTNQNLSDILEEKINQDVKQGFTRVGSHRADIHVTWQKINDEKNINNIKDQAANVLSRGEKKLLITALRLSQLPLLLNQFKKSTQLSNSVSHETSIDEISIVPIVLLDDLTAELDEKAIYILLETLASLPCQVFITSLTDDIMPLVSKYWEEYRVFHVEQGIVQVLD